MDTPYQQKSATEVLSQMVEHLVAGIVSIQNEMHLNDPANPTYSGDDPTSGLYMLQCGYPDIDDGLLVSVSRVYGMKDDSFYEFVLNTDYTIDIDDKSITFSNGPDDDSYIYVSYKYDQRYVSGLTNTGRGSVVDIIMSAVANKIADVSEQLNSLKEGAYIETSVGDDLDALVKLVNVTRNPAVGSSGYVTVYRSSISGNTTIVAETTIFSTIATDRTPTVRFKVLEAGLFIDGVSSARLLVVCVDGYVGTRTNVAPNKIVNVETPVSGITRVTNPFYYTDYEFIDLIEGKYTYFLSHLPDRVINTKSFPPATTDKGLVAVMNWVDEAIDVNTGDWTIDPNAVDVTVTENDPESGVTKVEVGSVTDAKVYNFELNTPKKDNNPDKNSAGYDQLFINIRGDSGTQFSVQLEDSNEFPLVSFYKFGEDTPSSTPEVETGFTLFVGGHGFSPTYEDDNIIRCRIIFLSVGTYYIDWIGLGTFLEEHSGPFPHVDSYQISYTSARFTLQSTGGADDFFNVYDGDSSDGSYDRILLLYRWRNNFGGGSDEENDELLRSRAITTFSSFGKGTKNSIRSAVLDVDGIKECIVKDFDDDQNIISGDIDVYVLSVGFKLSHALESEIIQAVEDNRSAGIRATIYIPEIRYVNFEITLVYNDSSGVYIGTVGINTLKETVRSVMNDYFSDHVTIAGNLYFSDLVGFIISELDVIVGGHVTHTISVTPTYSDDDYEGTYQYNIPDTVVYDNPLRVKAFKSGVSIVVQQGNNITVNITNKSSQ